MAVSLLRGPLQVEGFFSKELIGIVRQPKLIASLVLGPFLVLLLFGIGFRGQVMSFRTLLIVPDDPRYPSDPQTYAPAFTSVFQLAGVGHDEAAARRDLERGAADVVVVVPADISQVLAGGQQAQLGVLYDEADPTKGAWIRYFSYVQVSELNRRILGELIGQSRGPATDALGVLTQNQRELDALDGDLAAGNLPQAGARALALQTQIRALRSGLAAGLDAFASPIATGPGQADAALADADQQLSGLLGDLSTGPAGVPSARARVRTIRADNDSVLELARRITQIPTETLVSPFAAEAQNVLPVEPTALAYYTPAALALLLQHMGVTLAALSAVRDRLLGSLDLFRVSPVGAVQILLGKSLGFGIVLSLVAVALSLAVTRLLGVPSLGQPLYFWLALSLPIFGGVALGLALAVVSGSESQAVQLSLLVLLASVFFSGFFLPLEQLDPTVRVVSYLLPVTYGAIGLRETMLRGEVPAAVWLLAPLGLGLAYWLLALIGLRRQMRRA